MVARLKWRYQTTTRSPMALTRQIWYHVIEWSFASIQVSPINTTTKGIIEQVNTRKLCWYIHRSTALILKYHLQEWVRLDDNDIRLEFHRTRRMRQNYNDDNSCIYIYKYGYTHVHIIITYFTFICITCLS